MNAGIKEHLEMMVKVQAGIRVANSPHKLLLEHGRTFPAAPCPVRMGPIKHCYMNALKLASRRRDLIYVEGMALRIIPVEHAWCITADGQVVDNTFRPMPEYGEPEYFGIPIRLEYAKRVVSDSKLYSVLWNYDADYPMLRDDPAEWRA